MTLFDHFSSDVPPLCAHLTSDPIFLTYADCVVLELHTVVFKSHVVIPEKRFRTAAEHVNPVANLNQFVLLRSPRN